MLISVNLLFFSLIDDKTRVILKPIDDIEGSDYINANFIGLDKQYIAAQAPVPDAIVDFWRMILEYKVSIIVMLTKDYEGTKVVKFLFLFLFTINY